MQNVFQAEGVYDDKPEKRGNELAKKVQSWFLILRQQPSEMAETTACA